MILTEEQRAALKRVVAYMDEMYAIASPYHGCTEDANILRAMIDSSEHIREPPKMVGFDLERARGLRDFLQDDCAEVGDVWAEMIAEIERLRGFETAARDLNNDLIRIAGERDELAARIQELEDALVEERAKVIMLIEKLQLVANDPDWQSKGLKHDFDWYLAESKKQIESGEPEDQRCRRLGEPNGWTDPEGKIGPDADAKPQVWQITEERKAAIDRGMRFLAWSNAKTNKPEIDIDLEVLRAMLRESQ